MASDRLRAEVLSGEDSEWQAFVRGHPDALPYHQPEWLSTLAHAYGHDPHAVAFRSASGEILAGFPFVPLGGGLRRKRWVSLPFSDTCPPLLGPGVSAIELGRAVEALRVEHGVSALELRATVPGGANELRGVTHVLELTDPDLLFKGFASQVRRNIRKAESAGLTVCRVEQGSELTDDYFALHADTRRRLGVPSQPRRFFEALWLEALEPGLGFALLVRSEGTPIAGAVFLEWRGRIVYKYGASDRRHWSLRPNNLLFWHCIREGYEAGARVLDFGRSDLEDEGLRAFKRSWGAAEEPLEYAWFGARPRSGTGTAGRVLRPIVRAAPTWVGRSLGSALYRLAA